MPESLVFDQVQSINTAARRSAQTMIGLMSRSLPASIESVNGSIAIVKIEIIGDVTLPQIEVPIVGTEYVLEPFQKGDKGVLIPCDADISAMCGFGENVADLSRTGNLSSMIFFPIGNKKWKNADADMLTLSGLSDVMIRDKSHQLQLEDMNTSFNALVSRINALLLTIGAGLTTPTVLTPLVASEINPVKVRA
jgi:hypothetical protein